MSKLCHNKLRTYCLRVSEHYELMVCLKPLCS